MDVYYMSDSVSYSSFRSPSFRDYEKFPYGSLENAINSKKSFYSTVEAKKTKKSKSSKDSCPFCKEQKKRPLVAYMKKRENYKRSDSIMEEEEEGDSEENEEEEHNHHDHNEVAHDNSNKK